MRFINFYILIIFCFGIIPSTFAENDSDYLEKLKLAESKSDSINILIEASESFRYSTPDKGLKTAIKAYNLSLELNDTTLLILSSNKKAQLQSGNSLGNLALGSIVNSLTWAKYFKNDSLLAETKLVAGYVYDHLKDTDKSLDNYKGALTYFLSVNDSIGISSTYSGLGKVYYSLGDNSAALKHYFLAEKYWLDAKRNLKADLWNNIGAVYMTLEDFDAAKRYFEQALELYTQEQWFAEMAMINYNLGELELIRENYNLSAKYYNNAMTIGYKINSSTEIMWANEGLYRNKKQSGNIEDALHYFENYIRIRDSLSNIQNLIEVREIEVKYEQDQNLIKIKEQELEIYEKEITVQAEELKSLIFGGVILFILILFGIVILFYFRIKKKNQLLESQTQTISKSLFEKEILLKEVHHRVKNNMQVISSLLNLQKNTTDNKAVEYVINETQNRIQSIALVHQKLYQSKDVEAVDFEGYLTDLIDLQMDVFKNKYAPLELEVDFPKEVQIKLDLAISLGLIISEIITNAFKYAFTNSEHPKLTIRLVEQEKGRYQLNIRDNGPGLPDNYFNSENDSLGKELIEVLTDQINGELSYKFENGASFYINFPI